MSKVLSTKRIEELLTNAIKVDGKYTKPGLKSIASCDIDGEISDELFIYIREDYFTEEFFTKYYKDYYLKNFRSNSPNRKLLHRHLFEKMYGVLKRIEMEYEGFDMNIYVHHFNKSEKEIFYQISDIELMLEIDPDDEEE